MSLSLRNIINHKKLSDRLINKIDQSFSFLDTIALNPKAKNMNLPKIAPIPENNYLSVSEYATIVGIVISTGEENLLESTAAKICTFGGIATLRTFDSTSDEITAYPVTILAALFDVYLRLVADRPPATDNGQN